MIDVNDLRKGVTFELDGNLFKVIEYSHHKPGSHSRSNGHRAAGLKGLFRRGSPLPATEESTPEAEPIEE